MKKINSDSHINHCESNKSHSNDCDSNQQNAGLACRYCTGAFEHAGWCATREPRVEYAYLIVRDASRITMGDTLILHSLGVAWVELIQDRSFGFKLEAKA